MKSLFTLRNVLCVLRYRNLKELGRVRPQIWAKQQPLSLCTVNSLFCAQYQSHNYFQTTSTVNSVVAFKLSDIGEGIKEVIVKEWYVKEGDKVNQFDNICEVQSDKASVTITSRYDGIIVKLHHDIDDIAQVGQPLVDIKIDAAGPEETSESTEPKRKTESKSIKQENKNDNKVTPQINNTQDIKNIFAVPSVRRLAHENKIILSDVKGTGKEGRILKEDILKFIELQSLSKVSTASVTAGAESTYTKPIRGYAKTMIKTMTEAMEIPHFVYNDEITVTNLIKLREKIKKHSEKLGVKITYLPFFIKAISNALSHYPVLNSRLDANLDNIIYINNHNIGVAMDTSNGLVVPVIKNVQDKGIIEISRELNRLHGLSKKAKLTKEDLSDGTFTISNIGAIGGTYASPIILPPQRAIIALGEFKKLPRFDSHGNIVPESIACISGAADHRVVDGATMANFCNSLKRQIEEPLLMFFNI